MRDKLRSATAAALALFGQAHAQDILGAWKLQSLITEITETGETLHRWGKNPSGYLYYAPNGRMFAILTREDRPSFGDGNVTTEDKARAFEGSVAYSGSYQRTPEGVIHHVDVATYPQWVGTEQVRFVSIDNDILTIATAPMKIPDRPEEILHMHWRRVKDAKADAASKD